VSDGAAVDVGLRGCRSRPATERELLASHLYHRLHPAMAGLAVLFLAVVLAERAATNGSALQRTLAGVTWLLWATFVAEYLLRLVIAPATGAFLRRTWWQVAFLLVPVLSLARTLVLLRVGRPTRVALAAFRGSRSTKAKLGGRIGWIALVTAMIVFTVADVLYGTVGIHPYGRALHAAAQAAITGEPIPSERGLAQVLDIAMGVYAIVVFAALAGALGAFFVERPAEVV
jgi:voltage-gated potassium channel